MKRGRSSSLLHRALVALAVSTCLAAPRGQERPAAERGPAARPADALAAAWLHDLLGDGAPATLAAYRAVVEDDSLPPEHRARAAARALPIAAATDREQGRWWATQVLEFTRPPGAASPEALLGRLTAVQDALRQWAAEPESEPAGMRRLLQRFAAEPWRTVELQASRPLPTTEALERMLGEAESRGDAAEAARLRQELIPRRDVEPQRPRLLQLRRWSRDVLEWELAGQRDKAQRLLGVLSRRRGVRGPLTLTRLENELRAPGRRLSPRDRQLLDQALAEARQRAAAGDNRGVAALVGPALALLLLPGE